MSLPAEAEELVVAALWRAKTLGAQLHERPGTVHLEAFFPAAAALPSDILRLPGVRLLVDELRGERDWLAEYRRGCRPRRVGRRLWVDSGEQSLEPPPDAAVALHIPARTAFGTGSHATTRLMVEAIDDLEVAGRSVLDVGCGSGILTFAALSFGARLAVGLEIDPQAAFQAGQNARRNQLQTRLVAGELASLRPQLRFDLVLVNVLPGSILASAAAVASRVETGGRLIYAGFLLEQQDEIVASWHEVGLDLVEERCEGEWGLLQLASRANGVRR